MGLWSDSFEMLEAAKVIKSHQPRLISPKYYLLGHSLEVGLKGYLLAKGYSEKQLRKIGHDLDKVLENCNEQKIGNHFVFTEQQRGMVALLNEYYRAKELEYRVTGYKTFPDDCELIEMIEGLLNAIKPLCRESIREAT